jgi:8-amino-7-oxononanoate synthase
VNVDPLAWIDDELANLDARTLRRTLAAHDGPQGARLCVDGRELTSFASNDYLGLAADRRLTDAAARAAGLEGWGSGASPLIVGRGASHRRLEERLAEFEGTEAALCFPSGFAANAGTIPTLVERGDAIFADALNHASLIDGCRLSRAEVLIYPHRDMASLAELLGSATGFRRRLIVSDTLFSMDGDLAPLAELAELARRHGCMLMVDEAHATGVFGPRGRGLVEQAGVEDGVHIRVGTLSKALGCSGGFVSGRRTLIDWLVNRARPYVFSTAPPAAAAAAALAAIDIARDEPQRRQQLLAAAEDARERLRGDGWDIGDSQSQIIPILVGQANVAIEHGRLLRERGLLVPAIRPPSVPEGRACLRISLSHAHTTAMIDELVTTLRGVRSGRVQSPPAR